MKSFTEQIGDFFDQYVLRFNRALAGEPDIDAMTGAFAEHFIEASPAGVNAGSNTALFKEAVAGGLSFYRSMGIRSMEIQGKEITVLDDIHALAKVIWRSFYSREGVGEGTIEFNVFYLVQDRGGKMKIFAFITGDEQKTLQEFGLIPPPTDINQSVM
jgi:hypothetical protein